MARHTGMSPSTVHRIWRALRLQPHRTETFKFSRDPALEAKIRECGRPVPPGGRFEVSLDGTVLFSKAALKRHAKPAEVHGLVAAILGPPIDREPFH